MWKILISAVIIITAISFLYAMLIFLGVVKIDEKDVNLKLLIPGYALFVKEKKENN